MILDTTTAIFMKRCGSSVAPRAFATALSGGRVSFPVATARIRPKCQSCFLSTAIWARHCPSAAELLNVNIPPKSSPSFYKDSKPQYERTKVCLIGSGNWGSAIATIIGKNCQKLPFCDDQVNMWVHEEVVSLKDGHTDTLSHVINERHENVKYLPDIVLPENVVAVPDLAQACRGANLLVFVVPHQFLPSILPTIRQSTMGDNARGVSLIKGLEFEPETHTPVQISRTIEESLGPNFKCGVLMGANLANGVARGEFCESTLACNFGDDENDSETNTNNNLNEATRLIFASDHFSVQHCHDVAGAEVCGALKNVVALGAGFIDGLDLGDNTKTALLRVGLIETMDFAKRFFQNVEESTFLQSCGVADMIATCYGGRNRKCAEAFSRRASMQKTPEECKDLWNGIEQELLKGQKLQGTLATDEVYQVLRSRHMTEQFPLFSMIYEIAYEGRAVGDIVTSIHE